MMNKNIRASTLLIFDFDGTISRLDIFKILILLRAVQPSSWCCVFKSICIYWNSNNLTLRQSLFSYLWPNSNTRLEFFENFFKKFLVRILIRKSMIDLMKKSIDKQQLLILSANEIEVIEAFLRSYFPTEGVFIDIIATNSLAGDKPYKGSVKLLKYKSFLARTKKSQPTEMHCFFDMRSDFLLAKNSDVAINLNILHKWIGINKKFGFLTLKEYKARWG